VQSLMQYSFMAGEWSPNLYARTDLTKYKAGAATMRNFFVDYRGGASTRFGTKWVMQALGSLVRLIRFQASSTIGYVLEMGQNYIRFHTQGGPVLETGFAITGATQANPCVLTITGNNYVAGDWIFISGVGGMTQLNGNYYIVSNVAGANVTIKDLFGIPVNSIGFGTYTSGGTAQRIYTINSPFAAADLALVKFAQNVQFMVLTHPNYSPQLLTFNGPTNWAITTITFGATVSPPTGPSATATGGTGTTYNYAWVVTSVDVSGQESGPSTVVNQTTTGFIGSGATVVVSWTAATGAVSYNIYRSSPSAAGVVPTGVQFGFVGTANATSFVDVLPPDFSVTPPVPQNPFSGGSVTSLTITANGTYSAVPSVTIAPPTSGQTATAQASLGVTAASISSTTIGWSVGDTAATVPGLGVTVALIVATVDGSGNILTFQPLTYPGTNRGSITGVGTSVPTNPVRLFHNGIVGSSKSVFVNLTWGVLSGNITNGGNGYTTAPGVSFSPAGATATAVITLLQSNPSVPCYFQQRLTLMAPVSNPQAFYMSVPGSPYNFNISNPTQPDDAITGTLVSSQLNSIKSALPMPSGLIMLTSSSAWQVNGGSAGSPVSATQIVAQSQAYNGASDVPPLIINYDILYVQSKGSIVRDLSFNFYTQIYTGTDISVLSNHLFYGQQIKEWAWAEEPFKIVWAVRADGILLSLTFDKEQDIVGWARHDTTNGTFQSVASITEQTSFGLVDATYFAVQRFNLNNGNASPIYIERLADRFMPYGIEDGWCVDCAVQSAPQFPNANLTVGPDIPNTDFIFSATASVFTSGMVGQIIRMAGGIATITSFISGFQVTGTITQAMAVIPGTTFPLPAAAGQWSIWVSATVFSGLSFLEGQTVNVNADGVAYTGLTVINGAITLPQAASKVTIGLPIVAQLESLYLDAGQPTIQGKRKRVGPAVLRVKDSRGLQVGRTFNTLVSIKETGIPLLSASGLIQADEWVPLDPLYDLYGQICIQQSNPWPSTVLGIVLDVAVGDSVTARGP
jgi:hypothetical protein